MQICVLYFGVVRERVARTAKELVQLPAGVTVDDLVTHLCETYPALRDTVHHVKVAVNENFALPGQALADGDEVAIIPPVAGGAGPYCLLTEQPLSVEKAISAVIGPEQGAIVVFLGVVRGRKDGQRVIGLEYETYASMAAASLHDIARRCEAIGTDVRISLAHRFGPLPAGAVATVIAASAVHREPAFKAARECIELLKAETPIWKKEICGDGESWIEAVEGLPGPGFEWSASGS